MIWRHGIIWANAEWLIGPFIPKFCLMCIQMRRIFHKNACKMPCTIRQRLASLWWRHGRYMETLSILLAIYVEKPGPPVISFIKVGNAGHAGSFIVSILLVWTSCWTNKLPVILDPMTFMWRHYTTYRHDVADTFLFAMLAWEHPFAAVVHLL